jgi:mRNA-degrading endonuclease RelE of RelBE toxin-antitoxin system
MVNQREIFNVVEKTPEFQRDFKRLLKKHKSLEEDLENFQKFALKAFHKLGQENLGIFQIPGLGFEHPKVYKATKFACRALKGRGSATGIRIIYAYYPNEDKVLFIEIYIKSDQANENRARIQSLLKND